MKPSLPMPLPLPTARLRARAAVTGPTAPAEAERALEAAPGQPRARSPGFRGFFLGAKPPGLGSGRPGDFAGGREPRGLN